MAKKRKRDAEINSKEELNIIEFPLGVLSKNPGKEKTLTFNDTVTIGGEKKPRKWILTGCDIYGLPVSIDETIYLCLSYLTKQAGFTQKVYFSRYELLSIIGDDDSKHAYNRVEKALQRLTGVSIYTDYFYDKEAGCYGKAGFGIIDNFVLHKESSGQKPLFKSYFVWNDVIYKSLTNGNMKSIDLNFYFKLKGNSTKRLFRYLDKKLYNNSVFKIGLSQLAFEKMGVSRSRTLSTAKIRLIIPALNELKTKRFLKDYKIDNKTKILTVWKSKKYTEMDNLLYVLELLGIPRKQGRSLKKEYGFEKVKSSAHWILQKYKNGVIKTPAAFLVAALKNNYILKSPQLEKGETLRETTNYHTVELSREDEKIKNKNTDINKIFKTMSPKKMEAMKKEADKNIPEHIDRRSAHYKTFLNAEIKCAIEKDIL